MDSRLPELRMDPARRGQRPDTGPAEDASSGIHEHDLVLGDAGGGEPVEEPHVFTKGLDESPHRGPGGKARDPDPPADPGIGSGHAGCPGYSGPVLRDLGSVQHGENRRGMRLTGGNPVTVKFLGHQEDCYKRDHHLPEEPLNRLC